MIFPFLNGIASFKIAPVTWLLFSINIAIGVLTFDQMLVAQTQMNKGLQDQLFLQTQGKLYAQFIHANEPFYSKSMNEISTMALSGSEEKRLLLGTLAIRNGKFMKEGPNFQFTGDQVAVKWWRERVAKLTRAQSRHPSYVFGLSSEDIGVGKWLSYQFVHSGSMHLFGNMLFLLIFGSMLEPLIGSLALLVVYLGSGMVAAGAFLWLSGVSSIPLVGASGAVSGIMGLFSAMFWRRPVRYFYFLFIPKRGYSGIVLLPAWITVAMWMIGDLAGYVGTLNELGGVAYSAHLGGEVAGLLVGVVIFSIRFGQNKKLLPKDPNLPTEQNRAA